MSGLDDTIEIEVEPCNTVGPMDKTAEDVKTLATVKRVSIEKCQWGKLLVVWVNFIKLFSWQNLWPGPW